MQEPYIVIVDTSTYSIFFESLEEVFNPEQIIIESTSAFDRLQDRINQRYASASGFQGSRMDAILERIVQKGYPPAAILGCPFYTDELLNGNPDTPGLIAMGFKGDITLMLSLSQEEYERVLPTVFEQKIKGVIRSSASYEQKAEQIAQAIEDAGVRRLKPKFSDRVQTKEPIVNEIG